MEGYPRLSGHDAATTPIATPGAGYRIGYRRGRLNSAEGIFQCAWPMVLRQQIDECLFGEFLQTLPGVARQQVNRVFGFRIKPDQFASHEAL